jgi:two-component system chemotaxis sensor kinase CheA
LRIIFPKGTISDPRLSMEEILTEFLIESHENLDRLERDLVAIEKDPRDGDTLSSIFRTIHTLKGSSGFLGFTQLEAIAHVGENLLSKMRDGLLLSNSDITGALLATVDAVRGMLGEIEASGAPAEHDYSGLISLLERLKEGQPATEPGAVPSDSAKPAEPEVAVLAPVPTQSPSAPGAGAGQDVEPKDLEPKEPASASNTAPPTSSSTIPSSASAAVFQEIRPPTTPEPTLPPPTEAAASGNAGHPETSEHKGTSASDSNIRVDVGLLDKLVNLVGELVLARNQVLQFTNQQTDNAFQATSQRLNLITTELQGSIMKTRMQPIGNIWSKLPRVVRDLASSCGKQVRLEMEGKETELDKTIIEAIKDPLTHIVRNAVDHGIENPAARQQAGKPIEGCLKMRAYHEGGQVNIEISDDGGGLDLDRVKQKAVQKMLISAEQASLLTDHQAIQLVFMPGFSTAEKITNVSGRGVGMDVVKTNIEKIGGMVDMQTVKGSGTTLKIKIPLTLAIIPALIVTSGGERFAIPQVSLLELVRLEKSQEDAQIEYIHGAPIYRLRGQLLPLVYLNKQLKLNGACSGLEADANEETNIVVLQADGHPFGLVVDKINDTQEIVVKPLGKQLKGVICFAGATIMGDGKVALILDVLGLAQQSNVVSETHNRNKLLVNESDDRKADQHKQTLLLFSAGTSSRMAIPLSTVARLEEFSRSSIEYSGGKPVVRYRGEILPLVEVAMHLKSDPSHADFPDPMEVVVYSENGRSVGLVVGKIEDIVSEAITEKRHSHGNGILGSVVIQDRVTDILDVQSVIRSVDPAFGEAKPNSSAA